MNETIATHRDDSIELAWYNLAIGDLMSVIRILRLDQAILHMSLIEKWSDNIPISSCGTSPTKRIQEHQDLTFIRISVVCVHLEVYSPQESSFPLACDLFRGR